MKWITRERPKIDRIACPWLIKRFIDKDAEILFVPPEQVVAKAKELGAIPFDVHGVEHTHYGEYCTFDYFIKRYRIRDPAIDRIALIVRGADTDSFTLAPQSAGLWAISAGLSHNFPDDHVMLDAGVVVYDALYSWAKHHAREKHAWEPMEDLLLQVFQSMVRTRQQHPKRPPAWAQKLKEVIQDQMDTNLSLNLREIARTVNLHPDYVSRKFAEYFENLSFGEYIRKLRIDKATELLHAGKHSVAEVAYLTGFSDQSYFTRVFKRHTGMTPSQYVRTATRTARVGKEKRRGKARQDRGRDGDEGPRHRRV
jgi:hypothetical protein